MPNTKRTARLERTFRPHPHHCRPDRPKQHPARVV